jgi:hypothetical protein
MVLAKYIFPDLPVGIGVDYLATQIPRTVHESIALQRASLLLGEEDKDLEKPRRNVFHQFDYDHGYFGNNSSNHKNL